MPRRDVLHWSRETRLLLLTITVSVGALLLLAQFRFPGERSIESPPQPLDRLAARVTYDELAAIVERVERRITPSVIVLRTTTEAPRGPRSLSTLLEAREPLGGSPASVIALRVRPDLAIARLLPGLRVEGVLNDPDSVPLVIAADPIRRIALVRVPRPAAGVDWRWQAADEIAGPRYVVTLEGSRDGPLPGPVFLGRAERVEDWRWAAPLLVLARTPVTSDGALVLALDGTLIGMAVNESGVLAIVPARQLSAAVDALFDTGSPVVIDFGLTLGTLTRELVKDLGVTSGVVVAAVAANSPADGRLEPGDVVQSVDGQPAAHPDAVLLALARVAPNAVVSFSILRDAQRLSVQVPATRPAVDSPATRRPRRPR